MLCVPRNRPDGVAVRRGVSRAELLGRCWGRPGRYRPGGTAAGSLNRLFSLEHSELSALIVSNSIFLRSRTSPQPVPNTTGQPFSSIAS